MSMLTFVAEEPPPMIGHLLLWTKHFGDENSLKRKFELLFRLYAPKKEFFDKVWVLPDVERLGAQ